MSVQFEWQTGEGGGRFAAQPPARRRQWLGWPQIILLAVLAFGLGVAAGFGWRYWQAQQALRTDIEAVVAEMHTHVTSGDRAAFLSLMDPEDLGWRAAQALWFDEEQKKGERPAGPAKIVRVQFDGQRAAATVSAATGVERLSFILRQGKWFVARP